METKVDLCMVVPEVLNDNNYLDWSVRIRTYLKARDLWKIVEGKKHEPNFMALHVIQNGCGPEALHVIRNINSAKTAWDVLAKTYDIQPPLETNSVVPEILLQGEDNYFDWSARVRKYMIAKNIWDTIVNEPPKKEEEGGDAFKAWRKKDLLALHVIKNSCGAKPIFKIRKDNSAKDAWCALAKEFCPEPKDANIGVPPLPTENRLSEWSGRVRTYLESQDLWDDDDDDGGGPKNSQAALDVIKKSYGPIMKSVIKECKSAKDAWKNLSEADRSPVQSGDRRKLVDDEFQKFLEAMNKYDWPTMMSCVERCPRELSIKKISVDANTPLHWAVLHGKTSIVKQLVRLMSAKELETENYKGMTALAQVATCRSGNIRMAKCMLKKNSKLISIADRKNQIPVVSAFDYGDTDIARYLYAHTSPEVLKSDETYVPRLFVSCISVSAFDIASNLLQCIVTPDWLIEPDIYGNTPLSALASHPSISFSRSRLLFWERWIYALLQLLHLKLPNLLKLLGMKHIYELRVRHVQALELQRLVCKVDRITFYLLCDKGLFEDIFMKAVKASNHELIENILRKDPKLLLHTDSKSRSLFAYAVLYRQPRIFSLIYELETKDELINMPDQSGNTLLHMTGMLELATNQIERIPGSGLEMRSELQWFKELECMSSPFTREMKNDSGETARETFTKSHKNMKNDGEKWMKETASSSSVVGTLIITITFAATITIPGGNNGEGFPMFSDKKLFQLFILSNALSFVSSIAAVLTFLVILTTSYTEEDFFISLPRKLMIGLSTLSFSIATMMIAFCAALFIMMPGQSWMVILISFLASISIIWFLLEKYPYLVEMTKLSYGPHMFDKKLKWGLYQGMSLPTNVETSSSMS